MGNRLTLGKKVAAISLFIVVTKWLWTRKRLTSRKENDEVELLKQKKNSEVSEEEIGKVCQRYGLALKRNMLPDDVCVKLPSPTFDPWEAIVATLPELNESGCLRERVDALELIQYEDELSTESNLRRAHVVLSMIVQSYLFGYLLKSQSIQDGMQKDLRSDAKEIKVVPVQVARPYLFVSEQLGIAPIVCSCTLDTWNWRLKSKSQGFTMDNLTLVSRMTNEPAEVGFHVLPAFMNGITGDLVSRLYLVDEAIKEKNDAVILDLLVQMKTAFVKFRQAFTNVSDLVNPKSFDQYRLLLQGYQPTGVIFKKSRRSIDNPSAYADAPFNCKGPSAGQSTMIFVFDLVLGIDHLDDAKAFQSEMLLHIASGHRRLIEDMKEKLKHTGSLREYSKLSNDSNVYLEYEACVEALSKFRQYHLGVATRYLSKVLQGTGGSDFRSLLRSFQHRTKI